MGQVASAIGTPASNDPGSTDPFEQRFQKFEMRIAQLEKQNRSSNAKIQHLEEERELTKAKIMALEAKLKRDHNCSESQIKKQREDFKREKFTILAQFKTIQAKLRQKHCSLWEREVVLAAYRALGIGDQRRRAVLPH